MIDVSIGNNNFKVEIKGIPDGTPAYDLINKLTALIGGGVTYTGHPPVPTTINDLHERFLKRNV